MAMFQTVIRLNSRSFLNLLGSQEPLVMDGRKPNTLRSGLVGSGRVWSEPHLWKPKNLWSDLVGSGRTWSGLVGSGRHRCLRATWS